MAHAESAALQRRPPAPPRQTRLWADDQIALPASAAIGTVISVKPVNGPRRIRGAAAPAASPTPSDPPVGRRPDRLAGERGDRYGHLRQAGEWPTPNPRRGSAGPQPHPV